MRLQLQVQIQPFEMNHHKSTIVDRHSQSKYNLSASKSPCKKINGIKFYNFSQISSYKNINGSMVNETKKEGLKEKLNFDKKVKDKADKRIKNNELFYKLDSNPLINGKDARHTKSVIVLPDQQRKQTSNNKGKYINKNVFEEMSEKKKLKMPRQAIEFKERRHNLMQLNDRNKMSIQNKQFHNKSKIKQNIQSLSQYTNEPEAQQPLFDLDKIVNLQEQNFFWAKLKKTNIKHLINKKYDEVNSSQVLNQMKFCFQGMAQRFKKYKIDINRDLVRLDKRQHYFKTEKENNYLEHFFLDDIGFLTLLKVSSGKLTPDQVFQIINDQFTSNGSQQFIDNDEKKIHYNQNSKNQGNTIHFPSEDQEEILKYLKLYLKPNQQKYQKKNAYRKESIADLLDKANNLVINTIKDKKIHKKIEQNVLKEMQQFVEVDYRYPEKVIERDRLIEQKRNGKNKMQGIKLQQLLQTFQIKNKESKLIRQIKK